MATLIYTRNGRWLTSSFFIVVALVTFFFALFNRTGQVTAAPAARTPIYTAGSFTFGSTKQLLPNAPLPLGFQDVEPEIKIDNFGNIYVTAIEGVPAGVDLWKSTDLGANFVYLGQPDGAQCPAGQSCTNDAGLGGGDDSIDVSPGGYLYVSSLWLGSVTMSVSYDGATGGVLPGQKWEVNPAAAEIPSDDRQWVAAFGPHTVYLSYRQILAAGANASNVIFVAKSTDGGKTFPQQVATFDPMSPITARREGNLVVDPYDGTIYTSFRPQELNGHTRAELWLLKSTDGGSTWSMTQAYQGPNGTDIGNIFPVMAVDRGGNVHLAFSQCDYNSASGNSSNCSVYLTSSSDHGNTWLSPVQVNNGSDTSYAIFPWIVAGSAGVVDITWYGANINNSTQQSSWHLYFSQVTNAMSNSPVFSQVQAIPQVVHNQDICLKGGACGGNRDLAEYYTITLDPQGNANIAFADDVTSNTSGLGRTWFTKQTGGPSAYTPPAGPAPVTFAAEIHLPNSTNNSGEPSLAVDSHNCIYGSALGATFWASVDGGSTFHRQDALAADPPALGGGDEDLVTIKKMDGSRNDAIYYGDLLLADIDVFKSTDRGLTWSGNATLYGHLNASSDRQWFAADRINSNANQIVWEMDHELASEDIRVAASIDDSTWGTTSGVVDAELATTVPNTNPGPVFVNNTTHEALGVFLASTITTNSADPPFGKEPNVWDFIASPPLAGGAPPQNVANYPIFKGVIDSPITAPAGSTTYGSHAAAIFPSADADSAGNVYAVWSMISARANATIGGNPATTWDILFASSHDGGRTFYGPFKVSSGTGTSVFPWIAAGDAGKVDIVWYQSSNPTPPLVSDPTSPAELTGGPNEMPAGSSWNVMFAQSLNANSREPSFTRVQVSTDPNHRGNISIGGTTGSSDRSLADYFNVYVGPDGVANIMYTDNANATGTESSHIAYVRQNGGPLALTNPSAVTCLPGPPVPTVVSRKTHGGAGTFDIPLPLPPNAIGIECRTGGASNNYTVVMTFSLPVTFSSATVCSGTGSVQSSSGSGTNTITANLTGVTNAQRINVCLLNATDGTNTGTVTVPMGVLLGDTTADGSVNSADISQTKSRSGQVVGSGNFRSDVTVDGSLNSADISLVKSKSGTALPRIVT